MPPNINRDQVVLVQQILKRGRRGAATLAELGAAYDLTCSPELTGCNNEIRLLMLNKLQPSRRSVGRDVAVGVVSGALTHVILGGR